MDPNDRFRVFEIVPAGEALLKALTTIFEDLNEVSEIRVTAFELEDDKLACLDPITYDITIDMGNCVRNLTWMNRGATYIANTWFNLLFAAFHERAHVRQIRENAKLQDLENATVIMEAAADAEANSALLAYVADNQLIPALDELGWAGEQIKELLSEQYPAHPESVLSELKLQGTNMAATDTTSVNFLSSIIGPLPDEEVVKAQEVVVEKETKQTVFEETTGVSLDREDEELSAEEYLVTYA